MHHGPEPVRLPPLADGRNPIHALLDDIGLPWREPREKLAARFGIAPDPLYGWPVIGFDTAQPIVPDMLQPLTAQMRETFSPLLPATSFSGVAWFEDDARVNIMRAAASLAERFGEAPVGRQYNTQVCEWKAGAAAIRLIAWPPAWQSPGLRNEAHEREPRLRAACHINVQTGFRLSPTPEERRWIDSFEPVARLDLGPHMTRLKSVETAPNENELEYVREPPDDAAGLFAQLGHSRDRRALIAYRHQLFVIPAEDIVSFAIDVALPAKGPGGAELHARCRTACPDIDSKRIVLAGASRQADLDPMAHALAQALDRPLTAGDRYHDV